MVITENHWGGEGGEEEGAKETSAKRGFQEGGERGKKRNEVISQPSRRERVERGGGEK